MANEFYEPGDLRATRVKDLFTRIAPRYDLINDLQSFGLHRYWKHRVVKLAQPSATEKALDLCCGTGDLAFLMAQRGACVLGLDFNERMLDVAVSRNRLTNDQVSLGSTIQGSPEKTHPVFVQGDAMRLPLA